MDPRLTDMARFLIRERDLAITHQGEHPELPQLAGYWRGRAAAYDMAIAWLGGIEGFMRRELYEAHLLATAGVKLVEVDRIELEPTDQERAIGLRPYVPVMGQGPDDDEDEDPDVANGSRTYLSPMGGWEPRS